MLEYHSYHTGVFLKYFNGCTQYNQSAKAENGTEIMPEILVLLALHC
jgi:hypothetical protein